MNGAEKRPDVAVPSEKEEAEILSDEATKGLETSDAELLKSPGNAVAVTAGGLLVAENKLGGSGIGFEVGTSICLVENKFVSAVFLDRKGLSLALGSLKSGTFEFDFGAAN